MTTNTKEKIRTDKQLEEKSFTFLRHRHKNM